MEIEEVIKGAVRLAIPTEEERNKAKEVEAELSRRMSEILKNYENLRFEFLGSYARDTWLKENLEFDVFVLFPEDYPAKELERIGLEIGKAAVDKFELRYAAHPYVHGWVKGVEVDIVPCYALKSPERIQSAVDRTPFHHYWLKERIAGKQTDVRLLKKFLKSSNLYGAEYSVRGFSGYLCELLIIFFGSFQETVIKGRNLTRNTIIDVKSKEITKKKGLDSLLVIDPVDEKRNVAANLSLNKLAEFVEKCRNFVDSPTIDFFYEKKKVEVDKKLLEREIKNRGTGIYVIEFEKPEIVEDNLFPQLERACKKITEHLSRNKLMPLRSGFFARKKCYLIFETEVKEISAIEKRMGPVFEDGENVKKFIAKKRDYKPFIEEGRYYVYVRRKHRKAEDIMNDFIRKGRKSLGKNIGDKLENFTLLKDTEILKLNDDFIKYLIEFLTLISNEGE